MKKIYIDAKEDTPKVILNKSRGKFEISGRSLPEDASIFYGPIVDWIEEYIKSPAANTEFHFNLEYFNATSLKQLIKILFTLEEITKSGKNIKIIWHYNQNDELMLAKGQEIQTIVKLPFEITENSNQ